MAAKKHDQLLDFYSSILESVDLKVDDDGFISFQPAGAVDKEGKPLSTPAAVEGKRWVLPTREMLSDSPWDEYMAFHPLSENFLNGESAVLAKFKGAINLKLGAVIGEIMGCMIRYAADLDAQKSGNVGAKASRYLKEIPNVKEITLDRMVKIIERSSIATDRRFVNLYLKRGGSIGDDKYTWVSVVGFPFRRELDGKDPKVFGVTISKKDQVSFKALFDYILPENDDLSAYSSGPKSKSACKLDALLRSYANVASQLNEVIHLHRKLIPTYKDLSIDLSWTETLDDLDKLADVIPPLPGNVGEGHRKTRVEGGATQAPGRASRLFSARPEESRTKEEVIPHKPSTPREKSGDEPAPWEEQKPSRPMTFTERVRAQRDGRRSAEPARAYGRDRGRPAYGQHNYTGTANDNLPDWAQEGNSSRTIAGSDPRQDRDTRFGTRPIMQDHPARSFSERQGGFADGPVYGRGRSGNFRV